MLRFRKITLVTTMLALVLHAFAQGPNNSGTYYQAATGKKGAALKTALYSIISNHRTISYDGLLTYYEKTDKRADGKLWDMYSCTTNYTFRDNAGGYKKEGDCWNREHSVPQSWFSKGSPMRSDIVHVVPTDGYVNNRRGNLPFGETQKPTYSSNGGFCKVGPCSTEGYSGTVFEPNDEYKGDFARIYFYMATCYENKISSWSNTAVFAGNKYPAYKSWFIKMLLRWAKQDPVSKKEIDRNNAVYGCQQNRNPFVDYPGLEEYIWGGKQNVAFSYDNYDNSTDPGTDPDPNPDPDPDPNPNGVVFTLVKSETEINAGSYYILVFPGNDKVKSCALSDLTDGKNFYTSADVTIGSDETITTTVDEKGKPHQLLLGGTKGAYTIYDVMGKVYLSQASNDNKLYTATTASDNKTKWSISVEAGYSHITNNNWTSREIQFNANSPRFACYTGSQKDLMLYRRTVTDGIDTPATWQPTRVTVYTITGIAVRRNVERSVALTGLPKGIYILNGKKVVVN